MYPIDVSKPVSVIWGVLALVVVIGATKLYFKHKEKKEREALKAEVARQRAEAKAAWKRSNRRR